MRRSGLRIGLLIASACLVAMGCGKTPPPKVPEPEPEVVEEPEPPPPEPKCEALEEECKAQPGKKVAFGERKATFEPPEGWTYASKEGVAVALSPDKDAALAFAEAQANDVARSEALGRVLEQLKVSDLTQDALKKAMNKRDRVVDQAGDLKLDTWQIAPKKNPPKLDGEPAKLVVMVTEAPVGTALVGIVAVRDSAPPELVGKAAAALHTLQGGE